MDEYDLGRGSRASSPGDDYIDVEGNVGLVPPNSIHRTMGADTPSMSHATPPSRKQTPAPASSEVKRGRGRPRKQRDPVEEGMLCSGANPTYYYRTNPAQSSQELVLHCTTPHTYKQSIHNYYISMYVCTNSPLGLVYSVYPLVMLLLLLIPVPVTSDT